MHSAPTRAHARLTCVPSRKRGSSVRGGAPRSALVPRAAPARAGGRGVMSWQGGGAGAPGDGRRGRCFPALKRQEAEHGPASERDFETPDSQAQSLRGIRLPSVGTGHGRTPPSAATATPLGSRAAAAPPHAHTPLDDISPGRATLSPGSARPPGSQLPGSPTPAVPAPPPVPRRRGRVDAKHQFSSPFQVSTRLSGCRLRERRNFGARAASRRHHEVGGGR